MTASTFTVKTDARKRRLWSAAPVDALLEEHHVNDLRPGVTPLGLLFGDEVQREHPGSIDLGLFIHAESPDPLER
jgi:hypothetical protein